MSIETWKKEFYPFTAEVVAIGSWIDCIDHSILKWSGLSEENLDKHNLFKVKERSSIYERDGRGHMFVASLSCALCQKAGTNKDGDVRCYRCPLSKAGYQCETANSPYARWLFDNGNEEMMEALKKTKEYVDDTHPLKR